MKPERWRQVEKLYHAALERQESGRAAFVKEACGGGRGLAGGRIAAAAGERDAGLYRISSPGVASAVSGEGPRAALQRKDIGSTA